MSEIVRNLLDGQLDKIQRFGIIWYQEWLPKIICS